MAKKNGTSIFKFILIFALVLIGLPLGTFAILYYTNNNFEAVINEHLRDVPGIIGSHFQKIPTSDERKAKILDLSQYYNELGSDRASEKLYVIKQDDEELYNQIIEALSTMSISNTKEILENIRNIEMSDDLLKSLYTEMEQEKEDNLAKEVKEFEKKDLLLAINEIKANIENDNSYLITISKIMNNMKTNNAVQILYYLDEAYSFEIIEKMDDEKEQEINALLAEMNLKNQKIVDLAKIYEVKDIDSTFQEIGNANIYSIEDLAVIFMNLSPKKSAEVLINSQDQEFIDSLFKSIRNYERLENSEDSITIEISQILTYLNQYNQKIDELVKTYEKMGSSKVAQIVEDMLRKEDELSSFKINSNELYELSDASIILDVLRKMSKSTLSEILNNMTAKKAADLSRQLILK